MKSIKPYKYVDFYYGGYNIPAALNKRGQILLGVSFIFDLIKKNGYLSDHIQLLADELCSEMESPFLTERKYKRLLKESCTERMSETLFNWIDEDIIPAVLNHLNLVSHDNAISDRHRIWTAVNWKNNLLKSVSRKFCW